MENENYPLASPQLLLNSFGAVRIVRLSVGRTDSMRTDQLRYMHTILLSELTGDYCTFLLNYLL